MARLMVLRYPNFEKLHMAIHSTSPLMFRRQSLLERLEKLEEQQHREMAELEEWALVAHRCTNRILSRVKEMQLITSSVGRSSWKPLSQLRQSRRQMLWCLARTFGMFSIWIRKSLTNEADTSRYIQIHPDTSRYIQIYPDISRYIQIYPDISRYTVHHCNMLFWTQIL